ncbi:CotH kinase family protein [bacterium]|nr:CotH kinase family protein [bacterium]
MRYVVWAEDMLGNLQIWPEPSEPTPNGAYFTWDRTPATPLRHIWLHSTYNQVTWTTNSIGSDLPATIVIEGKVYDRVRVRHRGNTALGNYKKNFKFRFNKDNRPGDKKTWNLNGDMCDKSYMHAVVSWEITRRMGLPYCETESIHFRLTSGSSPFRFWGLYTYIEQPNEQFLERNGLDPTGNFYKSSSDQRALATYPGPYRKNSNEEANDWTDLEFFIEGFNVYYNSPPAFTAVSKQQAHDFLLQYADVDQIIDYLSSMTLIGNADQCGKNQLLYHDPATNRWKKIGWDLDLTLGQNYDRTAGSTFGYQLFNNLFKIDNSILLGCRLFPKNDGPWNKLDDRFMAPANDDAYAVPFRGAYLLRVRHWLDTMYTPENLHPFIDSYKAMIASDAALDAARWPGEPRADRAGSDWILPGDFDVWVQRIKDFITQRRANLYTQIAGFSDLPTPTPTPTATPTRTPTPTPPQAPPPRWFTPDVVALPANSGYHSGLLRLSDYVSDDTTAPQNIIFSLVSQSNPSVALVSVSSSGLLSVSVFANKVGVTRVVVRARDQDFATADTTIEIVVSGGATGVPPGQWRSLR